MHAMGGHGAAGGGHTALHRSLGGVLARHLPARLLEDDDELLIAAARWVLAGCVAREGRGVTHPPVDRERVHPQYAAG